MPMTTEPQRDVDRLTVLPPEILQNIISYLFESHRPAKILNLGPLRLRNDKDGYHDTFGKVLLTCKHLNQELHRWCRHFLATHDPVLRLSASSRYQNQVDRNPVLALVRWICRHCVWCGKKSSRDAIMMNGMKTCTSCDRKHWPEKITLTNAKRDYGLGASELMTLRYGIYNVVNVATTMFFRHDVEALAERTFRNDVKKLERLKSRREKRLQASIVQSKSERQDNIVQT